ncbi:MAG: UbiX family flavin prenyltransferase [Desulfovibrio sp.]|jgi:4-hydroxy-3-polyprenylbenzoate decarboxylase|nr:UbiX family flavin prenyltransferase [Desulfovibrio sp.]
MKRIIVAISGASGLLLSRELLRLLAGPEVRGKVAAHLLISPAAARVAEHEDPRGTACLEDLARLSHQVHDPLDLAAPMASGSWPHAGMVVCPCSMSTLAAIANGCGRNLLHRAADVCLKERRPLILVTRETPLSRIHLRNMLAASEAGAVIMPPCPAYYTGASSLEEASRHFAARILDLLGLPAPPVARWPERISRENAEVSF